MENIAELQKQIDDIVAVIQQMERGNFSVASMSIRLGALSIKLGEAYQRVQEWLEQNQQQQLQRPEALNLVLQPPPPPPPPQPSPGTVQDLNEFIAEQLGNNQQH